MAGLEIFSPSAALAALPDRFFSTVADDSVMGVYYFGKDNVYSRTNRRRDRMGPRLVTIGAPVVTNPIKAQIGGAVYWDTGLKAPAEVTFMAIAQISANLVVPPSTNQLHLVGTSNNNTANGVLLGRAAAGWQMLADYNNGAGAPAHANVPTATIGTTNVTVCCVFGTAGAAGIGVYDMTPRPALWSQEMAPAAGTTGRWLVNDTITIGPRPTAPWLGVFNIWAVKIWGTVLTADQRAAQYAAEKALFADLGLVI